MNEKKAQKLVIEINHLQIEKQQLVETIKEIETKIASYKEALDENLDFGTYKFGDLECVKAKKIQKGRDSTSYKTICTYISQQFDMLKDLALRKYPESKAGIIFFKKSIKQQYDLSFEMNTKKGESQEITDVTVYRIN